MPWSRQDRRPTCGLRKTARRVRPGLERLEGRVVPARNITIAANGLAAIPAGATSFADTGDYTIAFSALQAVDAGTITLRANNDITVSETVILGTTVGLNLLAGRNLTVDSSTRGFDFTIVSFQAPLVLTANAASTLGVNQANRDPEDASLTLNGGRLTSHDTSSVTLTGDVEDQAGANTHPNAPARLLGNSVVSGSNTVNTGRGNASNRAGIFVDDRAQIAASGLETIDLTGTSFADNQVFNPGVLIRGTVTAVDGAITIRGTGLGSGDAAYGIVVAGSTAAVGVVGAGSVTLTGTGGTGSGSFGIELDGKFANPASTLVSVGTGTLTLNGTGVGPAPHFGVSIEHKAQIASTGGGNVLINGGTGGVSLNPFGTVGGSVSVGTGNLTLLSDVVQFDAPGSVMVAGPASTLLIQTAGGGRSVALGAGDPDAALVFGNAAVQAISGFHHVTLNGGAATSRPAATSARSAMTWSCGT